MGPPPSPPDPRFNFPSGIFINFLPIPGRPIDDRLAEQPPRRHQAHRQLGGDGPGPADPDLRRPVDGARPDAGGSARQAECDRGHVGRLRQRAGGAGQARQDDARRRPGPVLRGDECRALRGHQLRLRLQRQELHRRLACQSGHAEHRPHQQRRFRRRAHHRHGARDHGEGRRRLLDLPLSTPRADRPGAQAVLREGPAILGPVCDLGHLCRRRGRGAAALRRHLHLCGTALLAARRRPRPAALALHWSHPGPIGPQNRRTIRR